MKMSCTGVLQSFRGSKDPGKDCENEDMDSTLCGNACYAGIFQGKLMFIIEANCHATGVHAATKDSQTSRKVLRLRFNSRSSIFTELDDIEHSRLASYIDYIRSALTSSHIL